MSVYVFAFSSPIRSVYVSSQHVSLLSRKDLRIFRVIEVCDC